MRRSLNPEIMDDPGMPDEIWESLHDQLGFVHRFLGNQRAILDALRRDPKPVRRVLDIGCGNGALLDEIRRTLGVDVTGVELRPPKRTSFDVPIVEADAIRDPLPEADVAICVLVAHHLSEPEIIALVRNAGRSVRRFLILDLIRSRLPLLLFSAFLCPLVSREIAVDGRQSIRRAYTTQELRSIVERAVAGFSARIEQSVTPLRSRQVIDIRWN